MAKRPGTLVKEKIDRFIAEMEEMGYIDAIVVCAACNKTEIRAFWLTHDGFARHIMETVVSDIIEIEDSAPPRDPANGSDTDEEDEAEASE
jgi:hypothetical protein